MKIIVSVSKDSEKAVFRQFSIKPTTNQELYEAATDVAGFLNECFEELEEEGF